jgi:hypothetical protein
VEAGKRLYKMLKDEKTIWKLNGMTDRGEYLVGRIEVISWLAPSPWPDPVSLARRKAPTGSLW